MTIHDICLLGGTGFVGRSLACELTRRGHKIRVLTRRRERHRELLVHPSLDLNEVDVHDEGQLSESMAGCDTAVNLVGILNQGSRPTERFAAAHVELPGKILAACQAQGIGRLLHMSALGASDDAPSEYLKSKALGEERVHQEPGAVAVTSFRPSVLFGQGDDFFNRFAMLLNVSPLFVPLACADAKFAPVYVNDVVRAMANSLDDKSSAGQRYDICGPREYSLRELVNYAASLRNQERHIWGLSDGLSRLQARVLERIPGKPFSYDNYLSMQRDSISADNALPKLGITPTSVETVVPSYLGAADPNVRYQHMRATAGREVKPR